MERTETIIELNAFKNLMEEAEIWELMRNLEKRPDIAWIRIELHNDTEIAEYDGKEVLALAGESPIICTSLPAM